MTLNTHTLLTTLLISLSFVENAPSNHTKKGPKEDELQFRLVFVDNNTTTISSLMPESTPAPIMRQRSGSARSKFYIKPTLATNNAPLDIENQQDVKLDGLPVMEDERQNWGLVYENIDLTEDDSYYNRPLNIPKNIDEVKVPNTRKLRVNNKQVLKKTDAVKLSACDIAIVTCCAAADNSEVNKCFTSLGCTNVSSQMLKDLCYSDYVKIVMNRIADYYKKSPVL